MKPTLVEDWKKAWKWFSVQAMALAVAIQSAWLMIPEDMKASMPKDLVSYATMALLAFGVAGRLVKQENKDAGTDNPA